jgi:hypothetical protein
MTFSDIIPGLVLGKAYSILGQENEFYLQFNFVEGVKRLSIIYNGCTEFYSVTDDDLTTDDWKEVVASRLNFSRGKNY